MSRFAWNRGEVVYNLVVVACRCLKNVVSELLIDVVKSESFLIYTTDENISRYT